MATADRWPHDDPPRLDHLLILRSWNHLPDPAATLARVLPRLRPGGSLLVVDNVAFGLARGHAQAQRAERSAARREHHRNDGLDDAARAIAGVAGLQTRTLLAREVRPRRSNQWLLHLVVDQPPPAFSPTAELIT